MRLERDRRHIGFRRDRAGEAARLGDDVGRPVARSGATENAAPAMVAALVGRDLVGARRPAVGDHSKRRRATLGGGFPERRSDGMSEAADYEKTSDQPREICASSPSSPYPRGVHRRIRNDIAADIITVRQMRVNRREPVAPY